MVTPGAEGGVVQAGRVYPKTWPATKSNVLISNQTTVSGALKKS